MMENRLKTTPLPIQLPLGKEDDFRGVIDLVTMRAIVYDPDGLGTEYRVVDIPDDFQKEALTSREYLIEKLAEEMTTYGEIHSWPGRLTEEEIKGAVREVTPPIERNACTVRCGLPQQGGPTPARCDHRLPPFPLDVPPC